MKAILTVQNFTSDFVTTFWTPIFVGIFLVIVAYALWPRNRAAFDEALGKVGEPGFTAAPYLAEKVVASTAELDPIIARGIEANPGQAEQYRAGKQGLLGFFVGQVMKETGGNADPRVVNERVRALLG